MRGRRLTDRQVAVLAALERLGDSTLPELREEFPELAPSELRRVLTALERRGLVCSRGDEEGVYLGAVVFSSGDPEHEDSTLPEPARTALRRFVAIMASNALVAELAATLAERAGVSETDVAWARTAEVDFEDITGRLPTREVLAHVFSHCRDINQTAWASAEAQGVPSDYTGPIPL